MSGHGDFTLACAYSIAGNNKNALNHCEKAIEKYKKPLNEYPDLERAIKAAQNSRNLIDAINNNTNKELLSQWKKLTISNLKLGKLLKNKPNKAFKPTPKIGAF